MESFAVIFDMDGVICHTNPFHAKAFEHFFDKYKIPYTEKEFEEHMYGKHNSYIMTHFFKRTITGEELAQLENEKESLFREIYKQEIDPLPHYLTFLDDLKSKGFKTAVATSAPLANLKLIVDELKIETRMESLLASENVTQHKPHPEVYLKSADKLGVPPSACVVFEDSFSGVTAARNAGMKVVGVLSSHRKEELPPCSLYIHDYSEIDAERVLDLLKS
ncbi:HAD family phosphatase [Sphingobacterium sp. DN00404]|uniref:HAD family phosphatase n=1 Tax=Sphingobacterium micropteri TaxID=2763501 RepID=A0ABR7YLF0_9SPHI|nr:HAD family phosphatase [Sphingobacterium micropteri]MBD1432142.1 HAD family phosphatase [Sphingobacterium micropteri]